MAGTITVKGVSKRFRHWDRSQAMTWQEMVLRGFRWRRREYFLALADVSFTVASGRMVGIMGFNGAGKSTLLRLVAGVGQPTSGRIAIQGRLGAILDLGVGFHPELTGRENIITSAVCSGLTRREVMQRFDEIVAFSELEEFLEYPLRTYSSGMRVRLAFAVASHLEPEVLLVDEVLAVGDMAFQKKCMDRMKSFKRNGCTGMIVSHAPKAVMDLCDDAIWLDHGRVVAHGPAKEVVRQYVEAMGLKTGKPAAEPQEELGPSDDPGDESVADESVTERVEARERPSRERGAA